MNRPNLSFAYPLAAAALALAVAGCATSPTSPSGAGQGQYTAQDAAQLLDSQAQAHAENSLSGLDLEQYAKDLEFMKSRTQGAEQIAETLAANGAPVQDARDRRRVIWLEPQQEQPNSISANGAGINNRGQSELAAKGSMDQPNVIQASNPERPPIVSMKDLLVPFKSQLARNAADSATPLRERLVSASLLMLGGDKPVDPALLYDLTDSEREIFATYQAHFVALRDLWDEGADTQAIRTSVHEFLNELSQSPGLRLNNFTLCSRIVNFGLYDKIESTNFQAMHATPVLTYIEIENFSSNPGADGTFITRLTHEVELYTERDGTLVYSWPALPAEDRCGRIRRDFFLPRQITLPANLTTGRYRLKVRITDEQTQEQAEAVLPISIIAGGNWADNR